ncbi:MAG: amidohydrolase family protein [Saprospiraceae bacterium]
MQKKFYALIYFLGFALFSTTLLAQETFPRNGVYDQRDGLYAFTNATIYQTYQDKIEKATLLIRDGKIVSVGKSVSIPKEAVIIDLSGKFIYPSFIEAYTELGLPKAEKKKSAGFRENMVSTKSGAYLWNEALRPEFRAYELFKSDSKAFETYRKLGFGSFMSHRIDGISRGTAMVGLLGDERAHLLLLKKEAAHVLSFKKGSSVQTYPTSLMGGIALLRQTYYDAKWYKDHGHKMETNLSLDAWNKVQSMPQFFDVRDQLEVFRAAKLGKEFGVKYIFKGNGDEYKRIDDIKATGSAFLIPVNFPDAYDVEDPYAASLISLSDMKHWELAPTNPARLEAAGIEFAFTSDGLKKKSALLSNIRKAIKYGLSEKTALKALTHTPAKLLGISDHVGSLTTGKLANFIVCSAPIFDEKSNILHNWVRGKAHVLKALQEKDLRGVYRLNVGKNQYTLNVKGSMEKPTMLIELNDSTEIKVKYTLIDDLISLSYNLTGEKSDVVSLSGAVEQNGWGGNATLADGTWVTWKTGFTRALAEKEDEKDKKKDKTAAEDLKLGDVSYPFMAFGWTDMPKAENILIKNTTVWTNEKDGILKDTDVLLEGGKIKKIGKNLSAGSAKVIDGKDKHLTAGIIDEHSHIAISRGVNECSQAVTAEVSVSDVVNSEDINIYRQLAGGVTCSQLLHGSCNPIGGQSAIIKLRWGFSPEKMKFENSAGFIKFALGENVKSSRSSRNNRFPDTRMGVEQVYVDAFTRAKEYEQAKKAGKTDLRKDLELEVLIEILNDKRFISCHSYVQSEINMLMHVADRMNFKVNTFTHILEGYKVADKMKKHGAGGSTFSDWWAYKYEVIDAIPQNSSIMHEQGVLTAINSDDAEMGRRLNQEAAKAVMYGGTSEEDALKFVTLNPAKLLHIDQHVGSIKEGKDADVVLWSNHPLSIYAKADMTFIDGIKFFDRNLDQKLQAEVRAERARLIQKMLTAKNKGKATQPVKVKKQHLYHCDHGEDEMNH